MRRSKSMMVAAMADRGGPGSATPATAELRSFASARGLRAAVAARELLHPSGGINEFLLAGEKRMAGGTDADFNVSLGGAGMINRAARANDIGHLIIGMNVRLHVEKR